MSDLKAKPVYNYEAGRNDGWRHAEALERVGPVSGSNDGLPGGERYLQGFSDGLQLRQAGYHANGSQM